MKMWWIWVPVALGVIMFVSGGCMVFGVRTVEQAGYAGVQREGAFEIREYDELVVVETTESGQLETAQSRAFRRLFDYISGNNRTRTKVSMTAPVLQEPESTTIAMTAPVIQDEVADGWRMAFVLPSKYTFETAPRPEDERVVLRRHRGGRFAVVRFSGSLDEAVMRTQAARLQQWITDQGLEAISAPRSAAYDPPFTIPFLRRNEIMIEVAGGETSVAVRP